MKSDYTPGDTEGKPSQGAAAEVSVIFCERQPNMPELEYKQFRTADIEEHTDADAAADQLVAFHRGAL